MAETEDRRQLYSKRKAITTLLPYAIWQERDGKRVLFDIYLHAVMALKPSRFIWGRIAPLATTLLTEASPQVITLLSPHIPWGKSTDGGNLVRRWAAATSTVQYTDEIGESVVDTLLQFGSDHDRRQHIPADVWSWLNKRPFLSPVCRGRRLGSGQGVIRTVRELGDINILKSYFLIVWSEWDHLDLLGFDEMRTSICEDFGGIQMMHHREDLIQRVDDVLGQLDLGFENLIQHNPNLQEGHLRLMKDQYGELKKALLEVNSA